ncbi:MAG: hypothetical protein FH761_17760 [Firmicutes bacterium]|nr:hypothetical protein [Bacillota bacterium]
MDKKIKEILTEKFKDNIKRDKELVRKLKSKGYTDDQIEKELELKEKIERINMDKDSKLNIEDEIDKEIEKFNSNN